MLRAEIARMIASRYLLSKKSHSVINLISVVTIVAVAVPTAAMMILLSVHNGFEEFIGRLWSTIDTPLVIEPSEGKYFQQDVLPLEKLKHVEGVKTISFSIEDQALLRYKERQSVATVKGVDTLYGAMTGIDRIVSQGSYNLPNGALVGMGVAYNLGLKVNLSENFEAIAPSPVSYDPFNPASVYQVVSLPLGGIFSLDSERDSEIIFITLKDAQHLFSRKGEVTSVSVDLLEDYDIEKVKRDLAVVVGDDFKVKDIKEQNEAEYRLVKSEKTAIYLIVLLVMVIASFTLVGTMIMLIIEKKDSLFTLRMMGLTSADIRSVFVWQGVFISSIGALSGLLIGFFVSFAQQKWGVVPINGASLLIDSYPVKVMGSDAVIVLLSVIAVTLSIALITNKIMIKN